MLADSDRVPQVSPLLVPRQNLNRGFRQLSSCKLCCNLSLESVATSAFQIPGENHRRKTRPNPRTVLRAEKRHDASLKRLRETSQVLNLSLSCQRHSKLANSSFGPSSLQPSHSSLRTRSEAHPRKEQDVVEIPVAVEIKRKEVSMLMPLQGCALIVLAREFRTVRPIPTTCMGDQRAM